MHKQETGQQQWVAALATSIFEVARDSEQHLSAITVALALLVCPNDVQQEPGDGVGLALEYRGVRTIVALNASWVRAPADRPASALREGDANRWFMYSNSMARDDIAKRLERARAWIRPHFCEASHDVPRAVALGFAWCELQGEAICHPSRIVIDRMDRPGSCNLCRCDRGLAAQFGNSKLVWCEFPGLGSWSRGTLFFNYGAHYQREQGNRNERLFVEVQHYSVGTAAKATGVQLSWLLCDAEGTELTRGRLQLDSQESAALAIGRGTAIVALERALANRHLVLHSVSSLEAALQSVPGGSGIQGTLARAQSVCELDALAAKCSPLFASFERAAQKMQVPVTRVPADSWSGVRALKEVYERLLHGFVVQEQKAL
jgi:hypothetical protein